MVTCGMRTFASCVQGQSVCVADWAMDIADSRLNAAAIESAAIFIIYKKIKWSYRAGHAVKSILTH
jgi:hypothetical protein